LEHSYSWPSDRREGNLGKYSNFANIRIFKKKKSKKFNLGKCSKFSKKINLENVHIQKMVIVNNCSNLKKIKF
jgi:hypothetical protein